ncbi:helix-turn-helix domain-containing protein [Candidatus Pacebacteria bacterium]|nr:helix-turn-helix domain-containing protein [Candidatus Paceibacterota bacterium]
MPHISKQRLNKKVADDLFNQLVLLVAPTDTAVARKVLGDLLTATEKVMLAKRLAAILLISEGASMYAIATRLQLSTSTVKRMYTNENDAAYVDVLSVMQKKKLEQEKFWNLIDSFVRLGMPSMGKDRWKSLR